MLDSMIKLLMGNGKLGLACYMLLFLYQLMMKYILDQVSNAKENNFDKYSFS